MLKTKNKKKLTSKVIVCRQKQKNQGKKNAKENSRKNVEFCSEENVTCQHPVSGWKIL